MMAFSRAPSRHRPADGGGSRLSDANPEPTNEGRARLLVALPPVLAAVIVALVLQWPGEVTYYFVGPGFVWLSSSWAGGAADRLRLSRPARLDRRDPRA